MMEIEFGVYFGRYRKYLEGFHCRPGSDIVQKQYKEDKGKKGGLTFF